MAKINLAPLKKLDTSVLELASKFYDKLDRIYDKFEKDTKRQVRRFRDEGKDIILPASSRFGLQNEINKYHKELESNSVKHSVNELKKHAKTKEQLEQLNKIRPLKSNKDNVDWSRTLSKRQYDAYIKQVNKRLKNAVKINPKIKVNELKKIVSDYTDFYKSKRLDKTSQQEANRVTNQVRLEVYKESGMVKGVIFIATIDPDTTDICSFRHNKKLRLDDPAIGEFTPALHVGCRSYLSYILMKSKIKFTRSDAINNIINSYPGQFDPEIPTATPIKS